MQETPPYSLAEIRMLLSQYLDGALEADHMVQIDALLAQFPHYRDEFLKLQATRGLVQDALGRQAETPLKFTKVSDMVWKNIAATLQADQQAEPAAYDAEFISAYYDGEIPAEDAALRAFESQLYGNAEANRMLAELGQVSETVRQFGYRLENACSLDIAAQVMSVYQAEQGITSATNDAADADVPAEVALLSAYADQELSPRDTIEANRLIESSDSARATLGRFTRLSEQIQGISTQLQAHAPDLWPAVESILKRPVEEGGLVVSINRQQRLRNIARIAVPTAAAAVLLLFFMPGLHLNGANSVAREETANSGAPVNASQPVAYQARRQTNSTELASLPGATLGQTQAGLSAPAAMDSPDLIPVVEKRVAPSAPQPLKPLLEPSPKIAAKPSPFATSDTANSAPARAAGKTPTSEEYLFNALNEQMPDEDVSAILGK